MKKSIRLFINKNFFHALRCIVMTHLQSLVFSVSATDMPFQTLINFLRQGVAHVAL